MNSDIEFDGKKDRENVAKRRVSLELAGLLFEGDYIERIDKRRDYGEIRLVATGLIGNRIYVCVYTWRGDVRRIISFRKANRREINGYYQIKRAEGG